MRPIHAVHLWGARPAVVLTRELVRPYLSWVTVAPISRTIRGLSTEVPVGPGNGLPEEAVVSCDRVTTIPASALGERLGVLGPSQEAQLAAAIRAAFDMD
jgi:mRNA interferase MazF